MLRVLFFFLLTIPVSCLRIGKGADEPDLANSEAPPNDADDEKSTIFLDINGVLNGNGVRKGHNVNAGMADNLRSIVKEKNADIVIDSAARLYPSQLKRVKDALGDLVNHIVGYTPKEHSKDCKKDEGGVDCRTEEIKAYLDKNPDAAKRPWIVMDDQNMEKKNPELMGGHWFATDINQGLTEEKTEEAKHKLDEMKAR